LKFENTMIYAAWRTAEEAVDDSVELREMN